MARDRPATSGKVTGSTPVFSTALSPARGFFYVLRILFCGQERLHALNAFGEEVTGSTPAFLFLVPVQFQIARRLRYKSSRFLFR